MFIHFPIILHKRIKKGKKQALIHFVQHASDHVHFKPTIISRSFKDSNLALNNHFSIVLAPLSLGECIVLSPENREGVFHFVYATFIYFIYQKVRSI